MQVTQPWQPWSSPNELKGQHKLSTSRSCLWAAPLKSFHSEPDSLHKLPSCLVAQYRTVAGAWASHPAQALGMPHLAVQGLLHWWPLQKQDSSAAVMPRRWALQRPRAAVPPLPSARPGTGRVAARQLHFSAARAMQWLRDRHQQPSNTWLSWPRTAALSRSRQQGISTHHGQAASRD